MLNKTFRHTRQQVLAEEAKDRAGVDEASIRTAFDRVELRQKLSAFERQKLSSSRIARVDSCEFSSEEKTCFSSELTPVSVVWGSGHVLIQRMLSSRGEGMLEHQGSRRRAWTRNCVMQRIC